MGWGQIIFSPKYSLIKEIWMAPLRGTVYPIIDHGQNAFLGEKGLNII
jgi:hypothetical protein